VDGRYRDDGLLLYQPVARIGNDKLSRFLAADSEDWHRHFTVFKESFVVNDLLIKSRKLGKSGMHGAWRAENSFQKRSRPATNRSISGPPNRKCHRSGFSSVPGADARQRRVHEDETGKHGRILCRKRITDHVADIVGDEVCPVDVERAEDAGNILTLRLLS
jgi:hypothetical protein